MYRFFGKRGRDFPDFKLSIRDFKENSARVSGLKVCTGGAMPKITIGITGLREILGREELCWELSLHEQLKINIIHYTEISVEKVNEPSLSSQKL